MYNLFFNFSILQFFNFPLAVPFALCAEVIAEHSSEDEIFFGCELVQRAGDNKPYGLQTLASSEIHVQILLSGRLQQVRNALTLQPLNGQLAILLVAGEQHHVTHTFIQFIDVVHQHLEFHGSCCRQSHRFIVFKLPQYLKTSVLSIAHLSKPANTD